MIKVNHLQYQYPKSSGFAISGLSFEIEKGEVFGFLGPSGSGKSTTQKILFKLLSGYKGLAIIDNKSLTEWDNSIYHKIGVCFELPNHYLKLTAIENLNFFKAFYINTLNPMDLLERVGLHNDAHKKVGTFSKGMKMRLNFIRSIIHNPEILFLDEPTSGLDPVNARLIKDMIIEQKHKGKTVFITTHQMHDADELCDRVAFIVDGQIKAMDSPENLKIKYSHHVVEVQFNHKSEKIQFPLNDLGNNIDFLNQIRLNTIKTIHSKEASLDEIFIHVTGKSLNP